MALSDEQKKKLEELRKARETTWVEEDKDRAEASELEQLEHEDAIRKLVTKLETDLGKRGTSWDLVDTVAGPIAVKLGDVVCYTKFVDATSGSDVINLADAHDFIFPNLAYPTREQYQAMCKVHGGIPFGVWPVLARLYRGERDRRAGKF